MEFFKSNYQVVMKLYFQNKILPFIILSLFFVSCSSDLNFDQVDDFKLQPVLVGNLAYFNVPANQFVDNGVEQIITSDVQEFDVFKEKFLRDDVVKAEFDFEIENTINRAFTVKLLLISEDNKTLETITLLVPAYSGSSNVIKYPTEVFENQRLALLKQTTKAGFVLQMDAGPPLNENSPGSLKLRSGATVYMEIE